MTACLKGLPSRVAGTSAPARSMHLRTSEKPLLCTPLDGSPRITSPGAMLTSATPKLMTSSATAADARAGSQVSPTATTATTASTTAAAAIVIVLIVFGVGACLFLAVIFIIVVMTSVVVGLVVAIVDDFVVFFLDLIRRWRGQGLELAKVDRLHRARLDHVAFRAAFDLELAGLEIFIRLDANRDMAVGFDVGDGRTLLVE